MIALAILVRAASSAIAADTMTCAMPPLLNAPRCASCWR